MLRLRSLFYLIPFLAACAPSAPRAPEVEHFTAPERAAMNPPFSDAVRVGRLLFLSGRVGNLPGQAEVVPGGITAETRQTLENIRSTLEANGSSLARVVKCTVMLADIDEWDEMNAVYRTYFPASPPARSAFGGAELARNARVEIECIATVE